METPLTLDAILTGDGDALVPLSAFDDAECGIPSRRSMLRYHAQRRGPARIVLAGRVFYRKKALRDWLLNMEEAPPKRRQRGGVR